MARGDKLAEGECARRGTHTTVRPGQRYCDLCRPLEAQQGLDRQRKHRASLRAERKSRLLVEKRAAMSAQEPAGQMASRALSDASYDKLLDELHRRLLQDARQMEAQRPPTTPENFAADRRAQKVQQSLWVEALQSVETIRLTLEHLRATGLSSIGSQS